MRIKQLHCFSLMLAVLVSTGLAACADRSAQTVEDGAEGAEDTTSVTPGEAGTGGTDADAIDDAEALPPTRQDTILLEGMPEPITLELYESPESFGLPFTTYYPEDLELDVVAPDEGEVVRFVANMGGVTEEDAMVGIYVYPAQTSEQDARVMLQAVASSYEQNSEPADPRFPWSIVEYRVSDSEIVGTYAMGQHAGRYFHVMITYPPEYGDGFGPRTAIVLDEWRWKDTGESLG